MSDPREIKALFAQALALHQKGNLPEAEALYREVITRAPTHFDALHLSGVLATQRGQFADAVKLIADALAYAPPAALATAHASLGAAHRALGNREEARAAFAAALTHDPAHAVAAVELATLLLEMGLRADAVVALEKAQELRPDLPGLAGMRVHAKIQICDWRGIEAEIARVVERLAEGEPVTASGLALTDDPVIHRQAAATWIKANHPADATLGPLPARPRSAKITLGYYSANYYIHPVPFLAAGLFEEHDRSRFEVIAFSFGRRKGDEMEERLVKAFDHFIDVRDASDRDIAMLSRARNVDIAVDLMGVTSGARPGVFARRAAPVQVNYLGYPGTIGADYMDYIIADTTVIPDAARAYYAEKVVWLPHSYQANDRHRAVSGRVFTRAEMGLPERGFAFSCFNTPFKILAPVFDVWMRILGRVPGSVLWLFGDDPVTMENLQREAAARGIDPARLVFARRLPPAEHLARQRLADLFLDTLPYNAHTTGSDALWAGLPMITTPGRGFAARVGASLLLAAQLPELIAPTLRDYEDLAVALANDPARLSAIAQKLRRNPASLPLFDTVRYTRNLEAAYAEVIERFHAGRAPDHFAVKE